MTTTARFEIATKGKIMNHDSDCATHNMPAMPAGECSCRPSFEKALEGLINSYSQENGSNTPDFILAEYMAQCLKSFNAAVCAREAWHGRGVEAYRADVLSSIPSEA